MSQADGKTKEELESGRSGARSVGADPDAGAREGRPRGRTSGSGAGHRFESMRRRRGNLAARDDVLIFLPLTAPWLTSV